MLPASYQGVALFVRRRCGAYLALEAFGAWLGRGARRRAARLAGCGAGAA